MGYIKKHTKWDYYAVGRHGESIGAEEADEMIEEIISILRKKRYYSKSCQTNTPRYNFCY